MRTAPASVCLRSAVGGALRGSGVALIRGQRYFAAPRNSCTVAIGVADRSGPHRRRRGHQAGGAGRQGVHVRSAVSCRGLWV